MSRLWPKQLGADYPVARIGREAERAAAEGLSEALGGLPLANEQAAAYCERFGPPARRMPPPLRGRTGPPAR